MNKRPRFVMHCTIMAVDVEGYDDWHRTLPHQLALRNGLYHVLRQAFGAAHIPWAACHREDRGNIVFFLAPPQVPKAPFVETLPSALVDGLRQHNDTHPAEQQIRLRMALHAGEVAFDEHGVTASAINLTFRLLAAPPLKTALADAAGGLALITSEWFYDDVVRHVPDADHAEFRPVSVVVKETSTIGWVAQPECAHSPDTASLAVLHPRNAARGVGS